jgi:hypothetical protein
MEVAAGTCIQTAQYSHQPAVAQPLPCRNGKRQLRMCHLHAILAQCSAYSCFLGECCKLDSCVYTAEPRAADTSSSTISSNRSSYIRTLLTSITSSITSSNSINPSISSSGSRYSSSNDGTGSSSSRRSLKQSTAELLQLVEDDDPFLGAEYAFAPGFHPLSALAQLASSAAGYAAGLVHQQQQGKQHWRPPWLGFSSAAGELCS